VVLKTFFVATPVEKFAGLTTHRQQDVNKDTYHQVLFIDETTTKKCIT